MSKVRNTDHGLVQMIDPDKDKPVLEVKTLQCCHCGGHWVPQPGSGRVRGWCMLCSGPICGPGCAKCVPTDLYLTNIEKGRPADFRPIVGRIEGNVPR